MVHQVDHYPGLLSPLDLRRLLDRLARSLEDDVTSVSRITRSERLPNTVIFPGRGGFSADLQPLRALSSRCIEAKL